MGDFVLESVVRGFHIYRAIWAGTSGEILSCSTEPGNSSDAYAVGVKKDDNIVGHVPRKFSAIFALFLNQSGTILCIPNGCRQYSADLPQGGLEIPCKYIFRGSEVKILKVKKVFNILSTKLNTKLSISPPNLDEPPMKKRLVESETEMVKPWVSFNSATLSMHDKEDILTGNELNDKHIDYGQRLLHVKFPHITGLRSTLFQQTCTAPTLSKSALQVIHCRGNHWITVSTVFDQTTEGNVLVYDSLYTTIDSNTVILLEKMFGKMLSLELVRMQRQCGSKDCGLFALGVCTAIAHGIDPSKIKFDQYKMRHHLITCFESNNLSLFPVL